MIFFLTNIATFLFMSVQFDPNRVISHLTAYIYKSDSY